MLWLSVPSTTKEEAVPSEYISPPFADIFSDLAFSCLRYPLTQMRGSTGSRETPGLNEMKAEVSLVLTDGSVTNFFEYLSATNHSYQDHCVLSV